MFACLYAHTAASVAALVTVAAGFTPRFEVVGPLVLLDIKGLARLFGNADEIGAHLFTAATAAMAGVTSAPTVHVAVAETQMTAALAALGQPGLSVIAAGAAGHRLAALPVAVLGELERIERDHQGRSRAASPEGPAPASVALDASRAAGAGAGAGGWRHPRATHQASQTRRLTRGVPPERRRAAGTADEGPAQDLLAVLRRWGIHTLGALAALPAAEIAERLGQHGVRWQRLAVGDDDRPLVPWVAEELFEATLDLEWPIEGLEPLSFVLARLFEPLMARLERADRGAAILRTTLHLVTRTTYARTLQLPAPLRDAKTLRALVLLDLESHPPSAAVDRVEIFIEPTPARVLQWELFTRAQPSPEQVSTLLARLTALVGDGHVGSPRLVDTWQPGVFEMTAFSATDTRVTAPPVPPPAHPLQSALRRFRIPVPARVTVHEGRPVRLQSDRHGVPSGAVLQAAGPWRTSGEWWHVSGGRGPDTPRHGAAAGPWDRDEWDVELASGLVYRIFVERDIGQWFIEGAID